jgi:uncharacterized repeat protein (TIGR02543 family)
MKRKYFFSMLTILVLFVACENPFVSNILPDRDGNNGYDGYVPPGSFVVTFNANGGDTDASPASKVVTPPATTIDALPTPPTRAHYTFTGWNTQANGSGSEFTADTTVTASITVYAQWTAGGTQPTVVVDFEQDSIGKTYESTGGSSSPTVTVVADPANPGQKSLQITSTDYNQAAIIPINLPKPLSEAEKFTFRICLTNGTLSYKKVLVYIADSKDTFVPYGFGNPANSEHPQFAANKLGETEEIPSLTLNEWTDYSISISGLNSAISNLEGDVFLAIGIHHSDTENITYLLDDLTFTFRATQPPGTPAKVDFENDAINKTYGYTEGNNAPTSVKVVVDPDTVGHSNQKSLEFTGTSGYNQAAVIPINLPSALNTYKSFTFRFNMKTGTLENKDMMVYAADSADKFTKHGFGNPSTDGNNFANLLLGQVRLADVKNQWDTYTIAIDSLNSAISGLSGNVYIAIGINHNDAITYYLDDLMFSDEEPLPPADFPTLVTFEDDATGKTYGFTRGDNDPTVTVAADPAASSQKSLRVATNDGNNNKGFNQAAIIPINLPEPLSNYRSFRFRFNLQTAGTLLDNGQPRKISVYVADAISAFKRYSFGNPANNQNQDQQFANLLVGEVEPDYGETNQWVDYAVNFNSPNAAINNLTGNVYVAIGINHDTGITYYLDDLTFSKEELQKQTGATLDGTLAVNTITASTVKITLNSVTVPSGSTQTIEYAVSETGHTVEHWQTGENFTGLKAETDYIAHARAAQNAFYNAGSEKTVTFTTAGKTAGATLSGPITEVVADRRYNRIVINAVAKPTNQTVEYAISTGSTAPTTGWQDSTAFIRLNAGTTYTVFARAKENDNYKAGTPISASFTTAATAPPVPASIVDFESDAVGKTYNRVTGQGSSTAAVIADPAHAGEKSLQITSTNWNNGAIIPINLPFALKNYETFTFRYRLGTSMPENNRGNGIWVYVMSTTSGLTDNQLGNNNASYTSKLLKNIVPNYSVTNQWVDYEIEINGENLPNDIKELQGNVFLVIGINSQQSITYQLDDLTFNIKYNFAPPPLLSPTSAIFNTAVPADIPVTMNLYGSTLDSIKNGGTALTEGTDYTVNENVVTLKASYFAGRADGSTVTLAFTSSNGASSDFVITIRVPPPSLSPTSATFIKAAPADIPVTVDDLYGNTLTIFNGATALELDTDYTVNDNVVTLNKSYFTDMSDGATVTLAFTSSNGASSNFVITIRATALVIAYDFTTNPNVAVETQGTGINTTIADGVLKVNKTSGYTGGGPHPAVVIPFDLGSTNLNSYTKLVIVLKGSGDTQNKTLLVEYQPSGTPVDNPGSNPTFGTQSTGGSGFGSSFATFNINKSGSPSATGKIKIVLSLGNTNPYVYEIQSIKFE